MGADHANGVASLPFLADGKSDDGGRVAGEVVFASGLQGRRP
jgi:hypothetical protein